MAVKDCGVPTPTVGFGGETAMDVSVAAVAFTVSVVEPGMPPLVAVMVVVPAALPEAMPALVIVATVLLLEDQVAWLVRFWWLPSL